MPRLTEAVVLLLLLPLFLMSAQEHFTLEVRYPQKTFTPQRGSSVKLSCEAKYDYNRCGLLHVVWQNSSEYGRKSNELTDPKKYLTTVNETVDEDNMRRRQIVTEILNLRPKDDGRYQCKAACDNGEEAMGHFITVRVR